MADRFIIAEVPTFTGQVKDWPLWKVEMKIFLMRYDIDANADAQDGTAKEKANKAKIFAQAMMAAIPRKWLMAYSHHADDGSAVWKTLCQRFEQRDVGGKLDARRALYGARLKNKLQAEAYVHEVLALRARYTSCGGKLSDEEAVEILVSGLTPEYTTVKDKLDEKDDLDWSTAVQLILRRATRLQREAGLEARDSSTRGAAATPGAFKGRCHHCKKRGHKESECRSKLRPSSQNKSAKDPFSTQASMPRSTRDPGRSQEHRPHRPRVQGQDSTASHLRNRTCWRCGKTGHISSRCTASVEEHKAYLMRSTYQGDQSESREHVMFMAMQPTRDVAATVDSDTWYFDTMASDCATPNRALFTEYHSHNATLSGVGSAPITGRGVVTLEAIREDGSATTLKFNALHVPSLDRNLISERALRIAGHKFDSNGKCLRTNDGRALPTVLVDDYHAIMLTQPNDSGSKPPTSAAPLETWHHRFAHADYRVVKAAAEMVEGMKVSSSSIPKGLCIPCAEAKMTKLPFPADARRATSNGELIHADLQGPYPVMSRQGNLHAALFTDDNSGFCWVYFLKNRAEAQDACQAFVRDSGINPKDSTLRADNAPELTAAAEELGFKKELTCPYTPEQNGCAERALATMRTDVIALLLASKTPEELWQDAAVHAVRVRNRLPRCGAPITKYEAWYGKRPDVRHLKTFGCHSIVLQAKDARAHKLSQRGTSMVHVGFASNHKGYLFIDPQSGQEVISRHARFDESRPGGDLLPKDREGDDIDPDYEPTATAMRDIAHENDEEQHEDEEDRSTHNEEQDDITRTHGTRRGTRTRRKPTEFWHTAYIATDTEDDSLLSPTPRNYREAMRSPEMPQWQKAVQRELKQMNDLKVWTLVNRTDATTRPIPTKWTFRKKILPDGSTKYKARLCACGNFQSPGSYGDTYAGAAPQHVTRIFAALSTYITNAVHYHVDVKGAYLHAPVTEDVFIYVPQGMDAAPGTICKLLRSMYGMHQSNRNWVLHHAEGLKAAGYQALLSEPFVFTKRSGNSFLVSEVHTDDADILTNNRAMLDEYIEALSTFAEVGSSEEVSEFCGIRYQRTGERSVIIHQRAFTEATLQNFGMTEVRFRSCPMEGQLLTPVENDRDVIDDIRGYQSIVGHLQWLANNTRPDISFAANQLSRFNGKPGVVHMRAAHHVMMYLRHNIRGIQYKSKSAGQSIDLKAYADSDWGRDTTDRKPQLGWVVYLQGGPILWRSVKGTGVAQSTCEAEYVAAAMCANDVVYVRQLIEEMNIGIRFDSPSPIYIDNRAAKNIIEKNSAPPKLRHVAIRFHAVKDLVLQRKIELKWIQGSDNSSDAFTKPLTGACFRKHKEVLTCAL